MSEKKIKNNSQQKSNSKTIKMEKSSLSNQNGNSAPPAKKPTK